MLDYLSFSVPSCCLKFIHFLPQVILGQQPGNVLTRAEIVVDWVNEFQAAAEHREAAAWNSLTQSKVFTTISARVSTSPGCWPKMTFGKAAACCAAASA